MDFQLTLLNSWSPHAQQEQIPNQPQHSQWKKIETTFNCLLSSSSEERQYETRKTLEEYSISLLGAVTDARSFVAGVYPAFKSLPSLLWPNCTKDSEPRVLSSIPWGGVFFYTLFKDESLKTFMRMTMNLFCSALLNKAASLYLRGPEAELEEKIKNLDAFLKDERDVYVMNQKRLIDKISEWKKNTKNIKINFGELTKENKEAKKLIDNINSYNANNIVHRLEKDVEKDSKLINSWSETPTENKKDTALETCWSAMKLRYNKVIMEGLRDHINQKNDSDTQSPETVITNNNNNSDGNYFYSLVQNIRHLFSRVENNQKSLSINLTKRFELCCKKLLVSNTADSTNKPDIDQLVNDFMIIMHAENSVSHNINKDIREGVNTINNEINNRKIQPG